MKVDKKIKSKKYNWSFNKEVSKSFDDHVKKSVPFYEISHNLITSFSSFFLSENSEEISSKIVLMLQKKMDTLDLVK